MVKNMKKILIVEDNPVNQMLLKKRLAQAGFTASLLAKNGQEAIAVTLKDHPDLVLMDIQLPDMNGNEAIRLLRQQGYNAPIVAVSADNRQEDIDRSRTAGANGYITKPIDFALLFAKLNEWLPREVRAAAAGGGSTIEPSLSAATRKVFIDDARDKLRIISEALAHADEEDQMARIKAIAHEYKGNAVYFGLHELERIACELDAGFRDDAPPEQLREMTDRLVTEMQNILRHEHD